MSGAVCVKKQASAINAEEARVVLPKICPRILRMIGWGLKIPEHPLQLNPMLLLPYRRSHGFRILPRGVQET